MAYGRVDQWMTEAGLAGRSAPVHILAVSAGQTEAHFDPDRHISVRMRLVGVEVASEGSVPACALYSAGQMLQGYGSESAGLLALEDGRLVASQGRASVSIPTERIDPEVRAEILRPWRAVGGRPVVAPEAALFDEEFARVAASLVSPGKRVALGMAKGRDGQEWLVACGDRGEAVMRAPDRQGEPFTFPA